MPTPFWIVDVFAEHPYAGNQLAVFTDAAHLTTGDMQRIAREIKFSETTFITAPQPEPAAHPRRSPANSNSVRAISSHFGPGKPHINDQSYFCVLSRGAIAPLMGIAEDPATGSAIGCFAGYLAHHRYLDTSLVQVNIEQGYEMGRPSILLLKAEPQSQPEPTHPPILPPSKCRWGAE
jgi:predicted PhzF superfamily epimerase YddE/YHI9